MMTIEHLKRVIGPLERRVKTMLMRATLTAVDDSQDLQQMQVSRLEDEVLEGCERVGQYGIASNPPLGSEVIIGQIGSNADHQVVLGVDDSSRPHPIPLGSTVIYDAAGTLITLDGVGRLHIVSTLQVTVDSPIVTITSAIVTINGTLLVNGDIGYTGALTGP